MSRIAAEVYYPNRVTKQPKISRGERVTNLEPLTQLVIAALERVSKQGKEIWLVSGKVTGDSEDEKIKQKQRQKNEMDLRKVRTHLQQISNEKGLNRIYFTSADIMPPIRRQIDRKMPYGQYLAMWRAIMNSGHVDGLYMTASALLSTGAKDEHRIGLTKGFQMEYESPWVEAQFAVDELSLIRPQLVFSVSK